MRSANALVRAGILEGPGLLTQHPAHSPNLSERSEPMTHGTTPVDPCTPVRTDECWLWRVGRTSKGYGHLRVNGQIERAHRVLYEMAVGPIPDGLVVRHDCDTPACVNPFHLRVGTQAENMRDAVERGLFPTGEYNARTKLTADQIAEIRWRWSEGEKQTDLAREFGVSSSHVSRICTWKRRIERGGAS